MVDTAFWNQSLHLNTTVETCHCDHRCERQYMILLVTHKHTHTHAHPPPASVPNHTHKPSRPASKAKKQWSCCAERKKTQAAHQTQLTVTLTDIIRVLLSTFEVQDISLLPQCLCERKYPCNDCIYSCTRWHLNLICQLYSVYVSACNMLYINVSMCCIHYTHTLPHTWHSTTYARYDHIISALSVFVSQHLLLHQRINFPT